MTDESRVLKFTESDLRELFALFSSPAVEERAQVYDPKSPHYHEKVDLSEEYELVQEKREYAYDSIRAVIWFLHSRGYSLYKDELKVSLESVDQLFI